MCQSGGNEEEGDESLWSFDKQRKRNGLAKQEAIKTMPMQAIVNQSDGEKLSVETLVVITTLMAHWASILTTFCVVVIDPKVK